jgi:PPK2 family polyphosphate:nucleotide phosphotransferase
MTSLKDLRVGKRDKFRLADFDPDDTSMTPGGKAETVEATDELTKRLADVQELLYAGREHKVLIVLQGMDTSGKDGTVRHVMRGMSPEGVRVASFKVPTETEREHDFLWRIHAQVPASGEIAIFNRSHYEDVLVVRVHKLVPETVWRKRYEKINDFEKLLVENGTIVLKFFLHISKDEQRERLQARLDDPSKRWKFQHGDIEERKLWDDYQRAYEEAIQQTSTSRAPWVIVPADKKWSRNWIVASTVVKALEDLEMKYPHPDLSLEKID